MAELVRVRKKSQITIPASVSKLLHIEEGDMLEMDTRGNQLIVRVKKLIPKEQAWFWTERWQAGEREAQADIDAGRVHTFKNVDDAIEYLHARADEVEAEKELPVL